MNDADAVDFFLRTTMATARRLPIAEARPFLRGFLILAENEPGLDDVRALNAGLCMVDDQLELIAGGQLKLNLSDGSSDGSSKPGGDGSK